MVEIPADALAQGLAWSAADTPVALATVSRTWGSSPCPVGSHMVVSASGQVAGSVSGGCVEAQVLRAAREVLAHRTDRELSFQVTDQQAWAVGLSCGGRLDVHVAVCDHEVLAAVDAARRDRTAIVVEHCLRTGTQRICPPEGPLAMQREEAVRTDCAQRVGDGAVLLRPHVPPPRLWVVGAVHIAQFLVPMASLAGFSVEVIDPRAAFATAERFPGTPLHIAWPDRALDQLGADARTAIVTLTHDPKLDEPALAFALQSEAFYIGALGSRRTHARRLDRLRERGFEDIELERIVGPVGLSIGARSPSEIAVSVVADLVRALRSGRPSASA